MRMVLVGLLVTLLAILDKAYRAGLDRIPDSTKKGGPWENMRGTQPTSQGTKSK
jgi:hypothetical protein